MCHGAAVDDPFIAINATDRVAAHSGAARSPVPGTALAGAEDAVAMKLIYGVLPIVAGPDANCCANDLATKEGIFFAHSVRRDHASI